MGELAITAGDLHFTGRWVDGAPRSVAAMRALLPLQRRLIHVRWSGEGCWIPFGDEHFDVPWENATSHPAPGELILYPGGVSECEILLAYGSVDFSSKVGQLAGNHFASLTTGLDQLRELGRRCLWEGAQPIVIEEIGVGPMIVGAPRFDLVVRGGTVVRADGSLTADVAITGGRIAAVEPGIPASTAAAAIDATSLLVLPGVIDVHTHTRIASVEEPDRFFEDTRAAAFGGTTTLLAFDNPGTGISDGVAGSAVAAAREWLDRTAGDAAIDIGLSAVLTAQQQDPVAELPALADLGVASAKCFMVYEFGVDERRLAALLRASAGARVLLEVHAEDRAMLDAGIAAQLSAGENGPLGHARSRPPACEELGTRRAIGLAIEADAPIYLVHVSCGAATDTIAAARRAGHRVLGETCPHYLSLEASRYALPRAEALCAVISPPLREADERDRMWQAVRDGELDLIATDHVPDRRRLEKHDTGQPFTDVSNGAPGVETLLAVSYGVGVPTGRVSVERLVDLLATTPARLFGMPTKGAVEVGRDADLVLFDPVARRTIRQADLHHTSDFTPYEGLEVQGAVREVLSRGRRIVRDGEWRGERGHGRYVERTLA